MPPGSHTREDISSYLRCQAHHSFGVELADRSAIEATESVTLDEPPLGSASEAISSRYMKYDDDGDLYVLPYTANLIADDTGT